MQLLKNAFRYYNKNMKLDQHVYGLKGGTEPFCAEDYVGDYHGKNVEVKTFDSAKADKLGGWLKSMINAGLSNSKAHGQPYSE